MTAIQITLPGDLARKAGAAGLFAPETIAAMLRERLQPQGIVSGDKDLLILEQFGGIAIIPVRQALDKLIPK